jgi:hypothetical protein
MYFCRGSDLELSCTNIHTRLLFLFLYCVIVLLPFVFFSLSVFRIAIRWCRGSVSWKREEGGDAIVVVLYHVTLFDYDCLTYIYLSIHMHYIRYYVSYHPFSLVCNSSMEPLSHITRLSPISNMFIYYVISVRESLLHFNHTIIL